MNIPAQKGPSWRTEPEIDEKRMEYLARQRAQLPDVAHGIYPFKDISPKLSRADVEWLLATHENGRGPVDWSDANQREREGLDLRGADLCELDLSNLPLACLRAGLTPKEREGVTEVQRNLSVMLMKGTDLYQANLEGANFYRANLENAHLAEAQLKETSFYKTCLDGAILRGAHLGGAILYRTSLKNAILEDAILSNEKHVYNFGIRKLLHVGPYLLDTNWSDVNLAVVDWSKVDLLGEEDKAQQKICENNRKKDLNTRLNEYQQAARANRQLAIVLQDQGLTEDAAKFAYHAQVLQRKVFWNQRNCWRWGGSALLSLLAGYGYRMWRILVAYLFIVLLCAGAYFVLGLYYEPHLSVIDAILTSVTAFHGRVFSEPFLHPGMPQLWVTAFEAITGLVIEGVFIAMLTQKFFGK